MALQPITNDDEHEVALREVDRLWPQDGAELSPKLDALVILIDAYERKRWPVGETMDPTDILNHAMSPDVGHTKQELVSMIGSVSGASQILSRKRPLTLDMIRIISARWGIPVDMLTPAYRLERDLAQA